MLRLLVFVALLPLLLLGADFDCIVIGTSPVPMLEAIYQACLGKKVLVLEKASECGGAWKAINVCNIPHADMGCHQLVGANLQLKQFLEKYVGCTMVPMERPLESCPEGACPDFYFSKGCHQLIYNLERILDRLNVTVLLNHPVESVKPQADSIIVKTESQDFSTEKVITIPASYFKIEGVTGKPRPVPNMSRYWHLYLLVQDGSSPKFSYLNYSLSGVSRCMNLTHFVGLTHSGRQLFVFQIYQEPMLQKGLSIIEDMKKKNLISPSAYLLESEAYLYEQYPYNTSWLHQLPPGIKERFEILETSAFGSMGRYITKWEAALIPYKELFRE